MLWGTFLSLSSSKKGQAAPEPPKDDSYKYVTEETVQGLVFVVYCFYKRAVGLFKDIVYVRNLSSTFMVHCYSINRRSELWL